MLSKFLLFTFCFFVITLSINAQSVIINEINYNSSSENDSEDWVEIHNKSNASVDISGWFVSDSNDDNKFVIPTSTTIEAGAYLVITRDEAAFDAVHPNVSNKFSGMDFNFSNGGELIRLFNSSSSLIDQVEYDDEGDWVTEPDGSGSTLELKDPDLDNSLASSWGASTGLGTPGKSNSLLVSIEDDLIGKIETFSLAQNYPNPFNPSTTIKYSTETSGKVELEVFNLLGKKIATLVNANQIAGEYSIQFNGSGVPSGIYVYRLRSGDQVTTNRMTLIK